MDPVVLAALIGGGSVCVIIWGAVFSLWLIDKRRGKRYGRK